MWEPEKTGPMSQAQTNKQRLKQNKKQNKNMISPYWGKSLIKISRRKNVRTDMAIFG